MATGGMTLIFFVPSRPVIAIVLVSSGISSRFLASSARFWCFHIFADVG